MLTPALRQCSVALAHQARLIFRGCSTHYITDEQSGKLDPKAIAKLAEPSAAEQAELLQALTTDFDVWTPLEAFDSGVAQVASWLGVPLNHSALRYERVTPRYKFYGGGPVGDARQSAIAAACPNMTFCEEHVRSIAPLDYELYQRAQQSFATRRGGGRSVGSSGMDLQGSTSSGSGGVGGSGTARHGQRRRHHQHQPELLGSSPGSFEHEPPSAVLASGMSPRCAPAWLRSAPRGYRRRNGEGAHSLRALGCSGRSAQGGSKASSSAHPPGSLEAAFASFIGACARTVSVESLLESTDDTSAAAPSEAWGMAAAAAAVDAAAAAAAAGGSETVPALRAPGGSTPACALADDVMRYRDVSDEECEEEVRCVFYFAPPPPPGGTPRWIGLPRVSPSPCNIALVDNTTRFGMNGPCELPGGHCEMGWTLRRLPMAQWPFPYDAPRTAHYLKIIAPLIFSGSKQVLAGDVKCAGSAAGLPCSLMRPGTHGDLRVAKNRWYKSRSVEGEFVSTWKHMRVS